MSLPLPLLTFIGRRTVSRGTLALSVVHACMASSHRVGSSNPDPHATRLSCRTVRPQCRRLSPLSQAAQDDHPASGDAPAEPAPRPLPQLRRPPLLLCASCRPFDFRYRRLELEAPPLTPPTLAPLVQVKGRGATECATAGRAHAPPVRVRRVHARRRAPPGRRGLLAAPRALGGSAASASACPPPDRPREAAACAALFNPLSKLLGQLAPRCIHISLRSPSRGAHG
jgi:hypothetical protein